MRATSAKQQDAAPRSAPLGIRCHSTNVLRDEAAPLNKIYKFNLRSNSQWRPSATIPPPCATFCFVVFYFVFVFARGRNIIYLCIVLSVSWSCDESNLSLPKQVRERRQSWTFAPSHQSFLALFCLFASRREWWLLMCLRRGVSPAKKKTQTKQKEIFK